MEFDVGDIVQTSLYEASILYKIVCFLDRRDRMPCDQHLTVPAKDSTDDVHLEVVWKKHKAIATAWEIGGTVVVGHNTLQEPSGNEMLVLGLAAS